MKRKVYTYKEYPTLGVPRLGLPFTNGNSRGSDPTRELIGGGLSTTSQHALKAAYMRTRARKLISIISF